MAYFNHAFKKAFLASTVTVGEDEVLNLATTGNTAALTSGEVGLFDAKTWQAITTSTVKPFVLAQGSWFTNDKISPALGGYQESVKSKVINPKYISKVWTTCATQPQNEIVDVCTCNQECGNTYYLRVDLKGSPALRFLSHNIYKTLSAYTGCCTDDCTATCTGALVDPTIVSIAWATQIVNDPILSQFVICRVTDWDGNVVATQAGTSQAQIAAFLTSLAAYTSTFNPDAAGAATEQSCLRITAAYVDTVFGNCTFTPTDHYELAPLQIYASKTDQSGDPCNVNCPATGDVIPGQAGVYVIQDGKQAQGLGESVLRELILDSRYRQEGYPDNKFVDSLRMREIEVSPAIRNFDRTAYYDSINILHNVPRLNNPTGTFDNDQYLLTIWMPTGTLANDFLGLLQEILNCAGNGVEIENYNGSGVCANLVPTTEFIDTCAPTTTVAPTTLPA